MLLLLFRVALKAVSSGLSCRKQFVFDEFEHTNYDWR